MKNDLISRSAHIDKFTAEAKRIAKNDKDFAQALMYVVTCLDAAPAVDAVEVVRCKDCHHLTFIFGEPNCSYHFRDTGLNDFCSDGERRTDEGRNSSVQPLL